MDSTIIESIITILTKCGAIMGGVAVIIIFIGLCINDTTQALKDARLPMFLAIVFCALAFTLTMATGAV
jgi:hypothetical protein